MGEADAGGVITGGGAALAGGTPGGVAAGCGDLLSVAGGLACAFDIFATCLPWIFCNIASKMPAAAMILSVLSSLISSTASLYGCDAAAFIRKLAST